MQWDGVVGQDHIVATLKNAVQGERIVHAYLFTGPRGTGKTTTARLFAKAVNCLADKVEKRPCNQCEHCLAINEGRFLDLIEIDAASNTSVDDVRDLREKINYAPSSGRYKVYIVDEVHMLSNAAFNALLKTLEEPPAHAIFVLATTEPHKIPATVISRCQRYDFRRIPVNFILGELKQIVEKEKIQAEPDALTLIARQATGSMRDAISLLDQLASTGEPLTLALTQSVLGSATSEHVLQLIQALIHKKAHQGLQAIHLALDGGSDPRQFARQVVDYLRGLMLVKLGNIDQVEATQEAKAQMQAESADFTLPALMKSLHLFNRAAHASQMGWQPSLQLELALTQCLEGLNPRAAIENDGLAQRDSSTPAGSACTSRSQSVPPKKNSNTSGKTAKPPEADAPSQAEKSEPVSPTPTNAVEVPVALENGELSAEQVLVQQSWAEVKSVVKKVLPETAALLNSCKSIDVEKGTLLLGFSSEILKSKMETGRNIELTHNAVLQLTKLDLPVICIVISNVPGSKTAHAGIESDGMVDTALSLGGKIVKEE
jgi:DNA polymerase-3 subunit gamma/tau